MQITELHTTELLIIATTIIVLLLGLTLVFLFLFIQKKKKLHFEEKRKFKEDFNNALAKSQNEIRERALENLSWEIHDNVGQLLSVSKMQLNVLESQVLEKNKAGIHEVGSLVSKSLQDLRALSKSLNPVAIRNIGLIQAIKLEIDRYNRLNFIKGNLKIINDPLEIDSKKETILFRIVQETINNTVKHAKASELNVSLEFKNDSLDIKITDNGIGFDVNKHDEKSGIGLLNMKGRAALIKATYTIESTINKGTTTHIKLNLKHTEI
ncbi:MAG: sensor histidine kinase [Flavobacteriaceae bacterium]